MWLVLVVGWVSLAIAAILLFALRQNQSRARTRARCRLWRARLYERRLAREGGRGDREVVERVRRVLGDAVGLRDAVPGLSRHGRVAGVAGLNFSSFTSDPYLCLWYSPSKRCYQEDRADEGDLIS